MQPRAQAGINLDKSKIHPGLLEFQQAAVLWALRHGKTALFLSTGMGKSYCEFAFGYHVSGKVLLFAPLAVGAQMERMAHDWPFRGSVKQIKEPAEITGDGIWITNYQRAERFAAIAGDLNGLILDESSCLKDETAVARKLLTEGFADVPFKLAASATPAPNDVTELTNHAEFLNVMKRNEVLATFFTHRDDGWYIRGHAKIPFYKWLSSWALVATSPSDLGFENEAARFKLPPYEIKEEIVKTKWKADGELFAGFGLRGITDRASVRRESTPARVTRAVEIVRNSWRICGQDN